MNKINMLDSFLATVAIIRTTNNEKKNKMITDLKMLSKMWTKAW